MDALKEIEPELAGLDQALEVLGVALKTRKREVSALHRTQRIEERSSMAFKSLVCIFRLIAPISSRKSVPWSAKQLALAALSHPPVKGALAVASSASRRSSVYAARLIATNSPERPMLVDDARQARLAGAGRPRDQHRKLRRRFERLADALARGGVLGDETRREEAFDVAFVAPLQEPREDPADVGLLLPLRVEIVAAELVAFSTTASESWPNATTV